MGLLENIWPRRKKELPVQGYRTFSDYAPIDVNWRGDAYELELTRACIERFATACMKLEPNYEGTAHRNLKRIFETAPNDMQTWPTFLARVATILEIENDALIIPSYADDTVTVTGLWPILYSAVEVKEYQGEPWFNVWTPTGENVALPAHECCLLTKFQYHSDMFGEKVDMRNTMQLIRAQEQAQRQSIQNGAKIRFIGKLTGMVQEEDLEAKRKRFAGSNLTPENSDGMLLYDQTFENIREVEHRGYVMETDEMERIENNVFNYYGTPKCILQNTYQENEWAAWYEGKIEPFAIKLGEGLCQMLLTQRERMTNNISFASNRLQYASMASKRNMVRDMVDRGLMTLNEARDILQMPHVPEGDRFVIRGEYVDLEHMTSYPERLADGEKPENDKEKPMYDDPGMDVEDDANTDV